MTSARVIGLRPLPMRVHRQVPADNTTIIEDTVVQKKPETDKTETTTTVAKEKKKETKKEEPVVCSAEVPSAEQTTEKETTTLDVPIAKKDVVYIKEEYKAFADDLSHISIDNFYEKQSKRVIKDAIAEIVAVEGPISQPALIRSLINTTSLGRASKQIIEHLDKLVTAADVKITRQAGVRFLWSHGTEPTEYFIYRLREQRNPEDVCKYELKNAVCYLIQENGPMTKEEIIKAMTVMFGYSRSRQKIVDGANAAIKAARELKAIEQNEKKQFAEYHIHARLIQ